jgi:hypothetical protein
MKYFELVKYSDNSVGAVFGYCKEGELEEKVKKPQS